MEKRYLDADALIKILKRLEQDDHNRRTRPSCWSDAFECVIDLIDDLPNADVVEVVRCKHCVHSSVTRMCDVNEFWCSVLCTFTCGDGYCDEGKREEQT